MSDICKYINNAYTDAAPYQAVALIQHDDLAVVTAFQAAYPNGRTGLSPVSAASIYGAGGPTGPYTGTPWIFVPSLPAGLDINIPNATQSNSTVIDVCGNRVSYDWVIFMVLAGPSTPIDPTAEAIRTRRWIVGFETVGAEANSGGGANADNAVTRAASRVPGGLGMVLRSNTNNFVSNTLNKYGAVTSHDSWERFYLRPYQFDASPREFWHCQGSVFPAGGISLYVRSNGSLAINERDQLGAQTVRIVATPEAIPLNRWNRIDIVVQYGTGAAASGRFRLWLNQVLIVDIPSALADGLGQNGNHVSTDLGTRDNTHNLEIDFDDWINAEIPILFNGLDWLSGSHVRHIKPAGDGAGRTGWTGDWRIALQLPPSNVPQQITSSTDGARLELIADADTIESLGEYQLGVVAMLIATKIRNAGGGINATLGFSIAGVDSLQAITVPAFTLSWRTVAHLPVGLTTPLTLSPLRLLLVRGNGVDDHFTPALQISAECLGAWGVEDQPVDVDPVPDSGIHNNPYREHVQYRGGPGAPPFGEVIIESGVYTGNGIGQDLPKTGPGHFLFVRRVTGGSGIISWHSSMVGPHVGTSSAIPSENMVQALVDSAGAALMRVAGNANESNVSGSTYQWITISDPAMRFVSCGAFAHRSPQTVSAVNLIADATFYPEAVFLFEEQPIAGGGDNSRHWYKGVGHAAANAQQVDVAEVASVATFGLGVLNTQTLLHSLIGVSYAAFRQFDGPGDPGGPGTKGCDPKDPDPGRPVALTSYTGDGVGGTRNITVGLGGRRPLFAIVQPHNSFARFKDPSHVGTETGRLDNGSTTGSTTEIVTGGVNFITVGTTLNASGIVYDVFCLPGDVGGSGWGANGVFFPVPPAAPCGRIWPPNPEPPDPPPGPGGRACPVDFPVNS